MTFSVESGGQQIAAHYRRVTLHRYDDALDVTEAAPLVDYILSGGGEFSDQRRSELASFIEQEMAQRGAIHITKTTSMFEAWG